ncbi:MAG TPA: phosphodiester glycosidase family protein [Caulobacteraceae bacterium]
MIARLFSGGVFAIALALAAAAHAASPPCRTATFEGSRFTVCRYDPATQTLKLMWRGGKGRPLDSLAGLQTALGAAAPRVAFAMNAGMYERDQSPLGLFVAAGKTVRPLNRTTGSGNFHLVPNGVFWTSRDGAPHIDETSAFADRKPAAWQATQSGPLLVGHGQFNPQITPNGASELIRNGVGVHGREALFVISDDAVSFGRFARFFRDGLGCPDALFLDGRVSSLWAPGLSRENSREGLGTFVVVLRRRTRN